MKKHMANRLILVSKYLFWLLFFFLISCNKSKEKEKQELEQNDPLAALPLEIPTPIDNPLTKEKAELGKLLFFDPILSGNKDVACATCHHPEYGFAENLDLSIGVNGHGLSSKRAFKIANNIPFVKRNSQTIVNVAFNGFSYQQDYIPSKAPMFWDMRAEGLEKQALEPIKTLEEMRGPEISEDKILEIVVNRIKRNQQYKKIFQNAFQDSVTLENLAKALASYQRTIIANNSRFDIYMRGDLTALSYNEIDGMKAFEKAGCTNCHNGPMFSDFKTHAIGVIDNDKLNFIDDGINKTHSFRTPTLRNLRITHPYMHNGKIKTLTNVLEFYEDLSGGLVANQTLKLNQLDPLIKKLNVDFKDISSILEFLGTLNDESYDKSIPKMVPSGLQVGGNLK